MSGSRNYEAKRSEGWVSGTPAYASSEPHHARSDSGAWTYEEMYHEATERALCGIIDGGAAVGSKIEVSIRCYFPRLSEDVQSDEDAAYDSGSIRYALVRSLNGVHDEVPLAPSDSTYMVWMSGADIVAHDGDEWIYDCFDATIERVG